MTAKITSINLTRERFIVEIAIDDIKEILFFMPEVTGNEIIAEVKKRLDYYIELDKKAQKLEEELLNLEIE